jgi:hypothetical protein
VKPRFIVFVGNPEKKRRIGENDKRGGHALNRSCLWATEVEQWIREKIRLGTIHHVFTVLSFSFCPFLFTDRKEPAFIPQEVESCGCYYRVEWLRGPKWISPRHMLPVLEADHLSLSSADVEKA